MEVIKDKNARIRHAEKADADALRLLEIIRPMDRVPMEKYLKNNPPTPEVIAALAFVAMRDMKSKNGKSGATKRHTPMANLREWTIAEYRRKDNWPSANKAAHELTDAVLTHGKEIGAHLSAQNAQRTIAEWIRKATRSSA